MNKPFAESCEQNQQVILDVLKILFVKPGTLLEVGSGTGQHAVFLSQKMPHLQWQPTDQQQYLPGIQAWLDDAALDNILPLQELDVTQSDWPIDQVDYVFSANTVHIMSWQCVEHFFQGLGRVLKQDGLFALYGPFNYNGQFSSDSNARFDVWLKQRDPESGVRDIGDLDKLAMKAGMQRIDDITMPVNNQIMVWRKG